MLKNGIEIGTNLPLTWDTTLESKGWYNITVMISDIESHNSTSDEVLVFVDNSPNYGVHRTSYNFEYNDYPLWPSIVYQTVVMNPVWIEVDAGESVHVTYCCELWSPVELDVFFRFHKTDDTTLGPSIETQIIVGYQIIHIENVFDLNQGIHAIEMRFRLVSGSTGSQIIFDNSLMLAQTFIPMY